MERKTVRRSLILLPCIFTGGAAHAADLSEQNYFSELPEVLTVTRLAQPLSETPGAVTILDRETIRRSGARELADVLRLVPGYLVAGWNGANPGAAYHAPIDDYGTRNLVLVDGRPVYSSLFIGDTHRGMMAVLIEDIERIEVLRGSNSAAYGANAMFGVINIITRHADDTRGGELSVTGGEGGIEDNYARIGWGNEVASFRLTTGRRKDSGYLEAHDDKVISQVHFRGDLRPTVDQELMLAAGATEFSAGEGFADKVGNPERTNRWSDVYLHGQWRRQLSDSDELKISANYNEEHVRDYADYALIPGVALDFGGRGRRLNFELQHQVALSPQLRAAWGIGYKQEEARSQALFDAKSPVSFHEKRLFGNFEWRPHALLSVNAGGFLGDHSRTGSYFAPRLMANMHVMPDHTVRVGVTQSMRTPTLFELDGDVRHYLNGTLIGRTTAARGNLSPEKLFAQEVGYFGNFRDWRLTLDVRAFHERMQDSVTAEGYDLPAPLPATGTHVEDYINGTGLKVRGVEYQMRWKPLEATEIWANQTFQQLIWDDGGDNRLPPTHMTTLALFQKLPSDIDLSLMFHTMGAMTWRSQSRGLPSRHRVDVRLAWPFRVGGTRAEAAFAVQAANGNILASFPYDEHQLVQERRAYGTLRIEF
jgi:iron complex outermembrane receptor protein